MFEIILVAIDSSGKILSEEEKNKIKEIKKGAKMKQLFKIPLFRATIIVIIVMMVAKISNNGAEIEIGEYDIFILFYGVLSVMQQYEIKELIKDQK